MICGCWFQNVSLRDWEVDAYTNFAKLSFELTFHQTLLLLEKFRVKHQFDLIWQSLCLKFKKRRTTWQKNKHLLHHGAFGNFKLSMRLSIWITYLNFLFTIFRLSNPELTFQDNDFKTQWSSIPIAFPGTFVTIK